MNKLIAVSIGDINGIGIELLIKLVLNNQIKNIVLFTDIKAIKKYISKRNYKIKTNIFSKNYIYKNNYLNIFSYISKSPEDNTLKSIKLAHKKCLEKNFIGMVTLPIRKDLIIKKIMPNFIGHTEYLQKLEKKKYSNMILYHKKIIISPLTTHITINSVSNKISKNNYLFDQIKNLSRSLKIDFNINNPRIIVSGLNPHAGENGKIGNEELKIITPTINKLKKNKISVEGPFSSDSMLIDKSKKYADCFTFMFHDQALIPFKYISNFSGVNYTGNLDVIRTSPDHGTAYKLIGKNTVSNISLKNCFKLINLIFNNRKNYEKSKKVTKSKFYNR